MGPLAILVVEDSELLHQMYDLILQRYRLRGAAVLHAYNGAEALRLLKERPEIDLILLDLMMPVMGGIEFLRIRLKDRRLFAIPVVVVTTKGEAQSVEEARAAGASGFLTKPLRTENLYLEIRRFFPEESG
jgi:two-component system, chemotaxis family, chemotaxis protein CheY